MNSAPSPPARQMDLFYPSSFVHIYWHSPTVHNKVLPYITARVSHHLTEPKTKKISQESRRKTKKNIKEKKKYTYTKVLDIVGNTAQKIAIKR